MKVITDQANRLKPKPDWLKPLFPWAQHALKVNGRMMAYVDEGERSALRLVQPLDGRRAQPGDRRHAGSVGVSPACRWRRRATP